MNKILIIVLIAFILGITGFFAYWYLIRQPEETSTQNSTSQTKSEAWVKNKIVLLENTTSTDTHKLDDGTFRMYLMKDGGISYADSKDATTFDTPIPTGVKESAGKFISNPSVLKIEDDDWIMVYEEQPQQKPGMQKKEPGTESQRNLYLATSTDGKNFTKSGIAIDSSKDDKYFASVPDLIKTSDGKVRMYYVCGGEAICSVISPDGKSFIKEEGIRMADKAVDPDVLYQNGIWVMYFSVLEGNDNKFYKATSTDGLIWKKGDIVLKPETSEGAIVDPDVLEIAPGKWRMFFGEMENGQVQVGGVSQINLFYADKNLTK